MNLFLNPVFPPGGISHASEPLPMASTPCRVPAPLHRLVDRVSRNWLELVPSWGSSILLHGTFILLLAPWLFARGVPKPKEMQAQFATQLTEDLTSLGDSDHAGDPFSTNKTDDSPSLSMEPDADSEKISQPSSLRWKNSPPIWPALSASWTSLRSTRGPRPHPAAGSRPLAASPGRTHHAPRRGHDRPVLGPGGDDQGPARPPRGGNGPLREGRRERASTGSLRHQRNDGGWSLDTSPVPGQPAARRTDRRIVESDTAATGLALLPLLGAGHIHTEQEPLPGRRPRGPRLARSSTSSRRASCSSGAAIRSPDVQPRDRHDGPLRGVRALEGQEAQRPRADGHRLHRRSRRTPTTAAGATTPGQAGDTSVFGWQMFALRSARLAGLNVPDRTSSGVPRVPRRGRGRRSTGSTYTYLPGRAPRP